MQQNFTGLFYIQATGSILLDLFHLQDRGFQFHPAGPYYPDFSSIMRLRAFLPPPPPSLDVSPFRATTQHFSSSPDSLLVLIYTPRWREALSQTTVLPKHNTMAQSRFKPTISFRVQALNTRPPYLSKCKKLLHLI